MKLLGCCQRLFSNSEPAHNSRGGLRGVTACRQSQVYPFELQTNIKTRDQKTFLAHPNEPVNPELFDMIDRRDTYGVSNQANCGRDPKFSRTGRAFQQFSNSVRRLPNLGAECVQARTSTRLDASQLSTIAIARARGVQISATPSQ